MDPQAWLDHYTANGWRVGRNAMKDWRAAVRTWERNGIARQSPGARKVGPREAAAFAAHLREMEETRGEA